MMVANHYVALLAKSGDPKREDQKLYLDMLLFLDDRHVPVSVAYHDRQPEWVRRFGLAANVVYFFKLLFAPASVVLVDFSLFAKLGLAVFFAGWLKKHRVIVSVYEIQPGVGIGWQSIGRKWLAWLCLQSAHRVLVYSEDIESWVGHIAPIQDKLRYFSYPDHNLGMEWSNDASWWPLAHFKPRWHKKRRLEEALNLHMSIN